MHHGHGLMGATLSTLVSGGNVVAPPSFSASQFWTQFRTHGVTWYTAVPTFGVPDSKYGEEVWAAVVLRGDTNVATLQAFSRSRLAAFKVPR
jgi:acyl-CoA synthetase (AMP-forming)/AMP-acid ligase II